MEIKLTELFEVQRKLDAEIERKHPIDAGKRIYKINLALLVELSECANEWRGFKFWSTNQEPNISREWECTNCDSMGQYFYWNYEPGVHKHVKCEECDGKGSHSNKPLLEEYVDCLHFILSIGNFINYEQKDFPVGRFYREETIDEQFLLVFDYAVNMQHDDYYYELVQSFFRLGEMLGFTWEQIETAYMSKNATNWERQANGY